MSAMESASPVLRLVESSRLKFYFPISNAGKKRNLISLLISDEYHEVALADLALRERMRWGNRRFSGPAKFGETIRMQYFIFAVPLEILAVAVWSITLVLKHIHVKRNIRSPSETIDFFLLSNLHLEIFLI
ncbi:unnamed protein product, partial [Allacma fusca]